MSGVLTIYRRELAGLFFRPLAWVLLVFGLLFIGVNTAYLVVPAFQGDVDMSLSFGLGAGHFFWWLLVLLPPLITMRMISEEARSGMLEYLLTAPVRDVSVVVGKLAAATTFMAVLWSVVPVYALVMEWLGTVPKGGPDWAPVATGYFGAVLISCFFCAIGLAISATTSLPLAAGFLSLLANVALVLVLPMFSQLGGFGPDHWINSVLAHLNVISQLQGSFMLGVLDSRGVAFFVIWICFFVFLATRLLEVRRWR